MKPPLPYFGSKTRLASRIGALLPPHEHYIEPFAGSLAVLLNKPPSLMETVNDLDENLVTFWRVLRDRPDEPERVCSLTPHSRREFELCADLTGVDDLERARRVWVRLTQGKSARSHTTWRTQYVRGHGTGMPEELRKFSARMEPAAARLARVSLECRPALDVIRQYGRASSVCLYCDPPYVGSTRRANAYRHEMTDGDHVELLTALLECRASIVLSGYASPLYDEMLREWSRIEIPTIASNSKRVDGRLVNAARTEVIWSNRALISQQSLVFEAVP